MIYSMTGFGRSQKEAKGYSVTVEIRTLNGKQLDVSIRMPKSYLEFEDMCRKLLNERLRRGRIEAFVQIDSTDIRQKAPHINLEIARFYWDQLKGLQSELPEAGAPRLENLLQIQHIFEIPELMLDRETLQALLSESFNEALDQVAAMRQSEGETLLQDFFARLAAIAQDLAPIRERRAAVVEEYKSRIEEKIKLLLGGTEPDEARLLQEVAFMADRSDINEEIVRLESHLDQLRSLFQSKPIADGKRLDFIIQELHREVNTIGSKTGDLQIVQAVVRMKTEIGKLKEQVQNIE